MNILVANPGSTSYKCKLFNSQTWELIFDASIDRIGENMSCCVHQFQGQKEIVEHKKVATYEEAIEITISLLKREKLFKSLSAVGFKVVLAKDVSGCVRIDKTVIKALKEYQPLAPAHNSIYLTAINIFQSLLPDLPLIGLFETAFHTEIPPYAYLYGIPFEYYQKYGIRKYGFHGASHRYISEITIQKYLNNKDNSRIISCHLGGSSSVCAIKNGTSIDTSMGMSPQSGLINSKRTGDLDCFALLYLMEQEKLDIPATRKLLTEESGLLGISNISGDLRDIIVKQQEGNQQAKFAYQAFAYSVKKYIGEYFAILNGADAVVFTAGIGRKNPGMRKAILSNMENLGIILDDIKNEQTRNQGVVSAENSNVKVIVIPTNEELIVAKSVNEFLRK